MRLPKRQITSPTVLSSSIFVFMSLNLLPPALPVDALSPDKKSVPRFRYLQRGTAKSPTRNTENGHAECRNTPCAATFRASCLKISRFRWKPKMRLRANPVVGGSGCGALGDRALPELPADIKDQLPTVGGALRQRPRPTFKLYQNSCALSRGPE